MICSCGNENATQWRKVYDAEGNSLECCETCGQVRTPAIPDVYFKEPYHDEHLADKLHPHGQYVESRRHKARLLKELGLREAGGDKNPILGKVAPFISDVGRRRKHFKENFGG